ncbi:MAG TPA: methyltransferase [Chitinophagaceae bacterium]|nr:methyltransferase [Chitinophagaceae bacterium]
MPNNYFRFKQFTVQQDNCAMKVCTDACLFGAVAADFIAGKDNMHILDIGAGTGLLSLMCAQENDAAVIESVEIDRAAAQQAAENFAASPWKERLTVHHTSAQEFVQQSPNQLFNFIISNPPFFENDLKSIDGRRNLALHCSELSLEDLLLAIDKVLSDNGLFGILLPFHRTTYFESIAIAKSFYLLKKISVKQTPKHNYFRSILFFGRTKKVAEETEVTIKNGDNSYTPEFTALLKDYYLFMTN